MTGYESGLSVPWTADRPIGLRRQCPFPHRSGGMEALLDILVPHRWELVHPQQSRVGESRLKGCLLPPCEGIVAR